MDETSFSWVLSADGATSLWGCFHDAGLEAFDYDQASGFIQLRLKLGYPEAATTGLAEAELSIHEVRHLSLYRSLSVDDDSGDEENGVSLVVSERPDALGDWIAEGQVELLDAEWQTTPDRIALFLDGISPAGFFRLDVSGVALIVKLDGRDIAMAELLELGKAAWARWSEKNR